MNIKTILLFIIPWVFFIILYFGKGYIFETNLTTTELKQMEFSKEIDLIWNTRQGTHVSFTNDFKIYRLPFEKENKTNGFSDYASKGDYLFKKKNSLNFELIETNTGSRTLFYIKQK